VIMLLAILLFNIPTYWKYTSVELCKEPWARMYSRNNNTIFGATPLIEEGYYKWATIITSCAIPFCLLLYFNVRLLLCLKKQKEERNFMVTARSIYWDEKLQTLTYRTCCIIALTLSVGFVDFTNKTVAFVVCDSADIRFRLFCYNPLKLLVSSSNFLAYCALGGKFKEELKKVVNNSKKEFMY